MLPSGNDAALTLATNFGRLMRKQLKRANLRKQRISLADEDESQEKQIKAFVKEMNRVALLVVHLKSTHYGNPHGLPDPSNHSTAFDQALLSSYAMKIPEFYKIVNTRTHTATSFLPMRRAEKHFCKLKLTPLDEQDLPLPFSTEGQEYLKFSQTWQNSNKLLVLPGFCGVKTGITSSAGSCLAVYFENKTLNRNLITVVLGSRNIEYRWKDARRLTLYTNECLMAEERARTNNKQQGPYSTPIRLQRLRQQKPLSSAPRPTVFGQNQLKL